MHIAWISALTAVTALYSSAAAGGQEPIKLIAGFTQERTLAPSDNHIYTVALTEGAAILGEADQHGVDLVIDEFGPDGKLIRTIDSPNGTEGPEPIDLTALTTGEYKLIIHTLDKNAAPGKYVMKVDRVVTAEENALRLAEKNYPFAVHELAGRANVPRTLSGLAERLEDKKINSRLAALTSIGATLMN